MTTPARRQYLRIKDEHQDAVLLFRMGDFYETFDEDARLVSRELEIALTSREMGRGERVPLAGIPYHSLEPYLAKLVKKGHRVAICEQVGDPSASKGPVDREVVRVVTPGTVIEESVLEQKANNYLASVIVEDQEAGLAYVDITTSEFSTAQLPAQLLPAELGRLTPAELLAPEGGEGLPAGECAAATRVDPALFRPDFARETLLDHFAVVSLEAFGCDRMPLAVSAAGAIVGYLGKNQRFSLGQIGSLRTYSPTTHMTLDPQTRRNLELFEGGRSGSSGASLLSVLDRTRTPMGGRLLRQWLGQPLLDVGGLVQRQEAVAWFQRSALRRERATALLDRVADVERLINRVRSLNALPRDLVALAASLEVVPRLRAVLAEDEDAERVAWFAAKLADNEEVVQLLRRAIVDDPPAAVGEGEVIRELFSDDLDSLRASSRGAQEYIAGLEAKERERTGIRSLKVGYNKVFGYYIEVSKPNLSQVPEDYVRRQTLVGGERFITPEMKEYESQILSAQDRIGEMETAIFRSVCRQVADAAAQVMDTAYAVALADVFASMAEVASAHGYTRPVLDDGDVLEINQGRHPVVERMLASGDFVPNDTLMSNQDDQLVILTGPNMSGKSTYIRQVAIIVLMAQIGSSVPAESATIGIVDRIFTRVGLQDDLTVGQSTFMVEMVETALILNHATPKSLIILDEIGRGTSTYDGLAIARAVAEYVHNHPRLGCKTLFATHYHELTQLADSLPRVRNYNVAVSEDQGDVVFLRRILPGGADKSYGVHVARFAGLPAGVINRAWEVLADLEDGAGPAARRTERAGRRKTRAEQLPLIAAAPAVLEELLSLDVASITPLEAINKLYQLQEQAREHKG